MQLQGKTWWVSEQFIRLKNVLNLFIAKLKDLNIPEDLEILLALGDLADLCHPKIKM